MTRTSLSGVTFISVRGSLFAFPLGMTCVLPGSTLAVVGLPASLSCVVMGFGQPWGGYQMELGLLLSNGLLMGAGLWFAARRPNGVGHAAS